MNTAFYIFGSVALVSVVSLVGLAGISFREVRLKRALAFLIPLAVGALLGDAFFHLIPQAFQDSTNPTIVSFSLILGVISFFILEKFLRWHHHHSAEKISSEEEAHGSDSKHLGPLILASDGIHNLIDGIIIGVSYLAGIEIGIATTLAVILHEIPQEIGDFGILIYCGYKRRTALFYNFLSALTAVLGAAFVVFFGSFSQQLIMGIIPFAAGVFIYIASSDLVPELQKRGRSLFPEIAGISFGTIAMYLLLFVE